MLSFIVVAALLYLLDIVCLSSPPWLIYLFIPLFFQWSVLTGCTYVLCSANCSHSEFECYCPLLITHLSLWLQQICKDSPDGKDMDLRPSSKGKRKRDGMSLSFSYGGHSATSIDASYVFFTSFIITSVSCNGATPSSNVPFLLIYAVITLLQYSFPSHRAPSSTSIF